MALKLLHEKETTDSCGDYLNNSSYAQSEGNGTIFILQKSLLFECQGKLHESPNWGHYFYVSNLRRDRHFKWSSEPRKGLTACSAKGVPSLLSYFKTLSIGPALGIEPATLRSSSSALPTELILRGSSKKRSQ